MLSSHQADVNLQRHESLYLPDGDIVLVAPTARSSEPRTVLFRVDKIFLSRHSPIFKDMLSFTPGDGPHDTYDGVPRVDLTDAAEDLESLLAGIYNASTLPLRRFDPNKPSLLMGTMRLAIKYEVDGIRDLIMRSVEEDWPHDPHSYEPWYADRMRIVRNDANDWWQHFPEPASAVQFATEFDCPKILTAIIYYMTTLSTTRRTRSRNPHATPAPHLVRWNLLDSLNFFRLLKAQELLKSSRSVWEYDIRMGISDPECCRCMLDAAFEDICTDIMKPNYLIVEKFKVAETCEKCLGEIGESLEGLNEYKSDLWKVLSHAVTESPVPWLEAAK